MPTGSIFIWFSHLKVWVWRSLTSRVWRCNAFGHFIRESSCFRVQIQCYFSHFCNFSKVFLQKNCSKFENILKNHYICTVSPKNAVSRILMTRDETLRKAESLVSTWESGKFTYEGTKSESCSSCCVYIHVPYINKDSSHIYLQVWAVFHSYSYRYSRTSKLGMARWLTLFVCMLN